MMSSASACVPRFANTSPGSYFLVDVISSTSLASVTLSSANSSDSMIESSASAAAANSPTGPNVPSPFPMKLCVALGMGVKVSGVACIGEGRFGARGEEKGRATSAGRASSAFSAACSFAAACSVRVSQAVLTGLLVFRGSELPEGLRFATKPVGPGRGMRMVFAVPSFAYPKPEANASFWEMWISISLLLTSAGNACKTEIGV
mmetsp:Transcript_23569/g.59791  ORF Transcript_23569/g.59791 Transcript_23569/m.59791 type:complete len:204 (+) Transcript_23569:1331-1942(+)